MSTPAETAWGIGRRLADEALWHQGRCTWLAAIDADEPGPYFATLPAELYDGTAGVGLFLAHLWAVVGDRDVHRVARGAIRHALARAESSSAGPDDGLYVGSLGVAFAAARGGQALDDDQLVQRGVRLARLAAAPREGRELDLVSGEAGRIAALLALRAEIGDAAVEGARAAGRVLLERGDEVVLTGYSHGRSGVGAALLELWAVTGEDGLRTAAEAAFASEREHLDAREGNWADLRLNGDCDDTPSYATAWCHGAPGIALARLRAHELTGAAAARQEALIGLRTTDRYARAALAAEGFDLSPCHGLTGLAEVLSEGERILGDAWPGGRGVAAQVAAAAAERHGAGDIWPCGVPFGETPALMVGLAGIGLFLLRLHDRGIPSVLLVGAATGNPAQETDGSTPDGGLSTQRC